VEDLTDPIDARRSLFALSNAHIGLRANLDEGEPFALPGTYRREGRVWRPYRSRGAAVIGGKDLAMW
jgi:alpha,alpha-trehalose phosphorylase